MLPSDNLSAYDSSRTPRDQGGDPNNTDPSVRRRIQNRISQRNSRQRRAAQKRASQDSGQDTQHSQCHQCGAKATASTTSDHTTPPAIHDGPSTPLPSLQNALVAPITPNSFPEHELGFLYDFEVEQGCTDNTTLQQSLKSCETTAPDLGHSAVQVGLAQHHTLVALSNAETVVPDPFLDGTKTDTRTRRKTPLHICSENGNHKIAEMLLQGGADINAVDGTGRSALHYGAESGHDEVVKLLLKRRAKLDVVDDRGVSVLHAAVVNNHESTVFLLLEAGTNPEI